MTDVGLKELLKAGVHFGHQTRRWNPKMRKYIFAERGGIYLIDLQKTLQQLERARKVIDDVVARGESVLFVCTKPQLADLVQSEAERCGAFYVTERWLGGMLTNFQTIKSNISRLKELERGFDDGTFEHYTKKEQLQLDRERERLDRYLEGIKDMNQLPGLVYVVDAKKEEIAVREANRLEIPVVAIADTNADPDMLDVPVPGNDDAIRSVSLITRAVADAVEMTRQAAPEEAGEPRETYTYSSDAAEAGEEGGPRRSRPRKRRRPRPEVIAKRRGESEESADEEAEDGGSDEAADEVSGESTDEAAGESTGEEADEAGDEAEREKVTAAASSGEEGADETDDGS